MYRYIAYVVLLSVRVNTNPNNNLNSEKILEENTNIAILIKGIDVKEDNYAKKDVINDIADLKYEDLYVNIGPKAKAEYKRIPRETDDDYDEGGFISTNNKTDHDFVDNISNCPDNFTRSPWGKCISCDEHMRIFGKTGKDC
ncbi:uncharacterized protein LOC123702620 [Colias croceus]|uniref:uncharacterized protein LOC123702620 n=1 Tax=Colias crocea TaxID=72248 RepID=UPI001E27C734|nr:uncharacterized protein LOC123702620 [Colias croceus]